MPTWAELFGGDSVVAADILDRLLDRAIVINIKGPSWRLREHQALTQPLGQLVDADPDHDSEVSLVAGPRRTRDENRPDASSALT